jgi:hypothetical protein
MSLPGDLTMILDRWTIHLNVGVGLYPVWERPRACQPGQGRDESRTVDYIIPYFVADVNIKMAWGHRGIRVSSHRESNGVSRV